MVGLKVVRMAATMAESLVGYWVVQRVVSKDVKSAAPLVALRDWRKVVLKAASMDES